MRNAFIQAQLEQYITLAQFAVLPKHQKRYRILQLEHAFETTFFTHCRNGGWMQEVVGEDEAWIHVQGMKEWHVRSALHSLQYANDVANIPKVEVGPPSDADKRTLEGQGTGAQFEGANAV